MNVLFEFPLAFAAFASLPILAAIYLLRNRYRNRVVSSLMLWGLQRQHRQGGLNLDRLQTPLLFVLELLTLILLSLAAAGPLLRTRTEARRMVIVLDDSFSMQAGHEVSVRQTAGEAVKRVLEDSEPFRVSFVLAGSEPTVLARDVRSMGEASAALDGWRCLSPRADVDKALTLAAELADTRARIMLVSDHSLENLAPDSPLECRAFGRAQDNAGFLAAERTLADGRDRCLLMVGSFSEQPRPVTLTVTSADGAATVYEKTIDIVPDEPFQVVFEPPPGVDLVASIDDDALAIDNRVDLPAPLERPVRVAVDIKDADLSEAVRSALEAIPAAQQVTESPDLVICDAAVPDAAGRTFWTLQIHADPNAAAFTGPFIVDRNHPLTEGLDLQGIIWAAGPSDRRAMPIVAAGNTTLLEEEPLRLRDRRFDLYLTPRRSTLTRSANWPILFWNLISLRQQSLEGLRRSSYRLGDPVLLELPSEWQEVVVVRPDKTRQPLTRTPSLLAIETRLPGRYQLVSEKGRSVFAVNAIAPHESDLRTCRTAVQSPPDQAEQFWWEYRPWDGILLLLAGLLLMLHRYVIVRQSKGGEG